MTTRSNLAEHYSRLLNIEPRYPTESEAEFRERIARTLFDAGYRVYAHEALLNERMSGDPFSSGPLDRGYGDRFITETARMVQAVFEKEQRMSQLPRRLRWFGRG